MPHYTKDSIDEVINASDILSIIGEYTSLQQRGDQYWGCCPFHMEKTASFKVDPSSKLYYCFGCHAGGSVVNFIMEQEKLSYPEALAFLSAKTGVPLRGEEFDGGQKPDPKAKLIEQYKELYDRVSSTFHYFLTENEMGKYALKYILERGISEETLKKFRIGFAPADRYWLKKFLISKNFSEDFLNDSGLFSKNYKDISFFSNRLMFPIFDRQGNVVAMGGRQLDSNPSSPKYLNSGDLLHYKKGESLYGFNFAKKFIRENKKAIFCEGYMDCIAYHQCGIEYAVAPLGTALTEEQIKTVRPFVSEILLSFDSDEAGQKATKRAILMLRKHSITVRIIQLSGGKDPAEIMLNYGANTLTKEVDSAILDSDYLLSKLGKMYSIETPEGKTKASLEFFEYIDVLSSDIHKQSCLEQLCQTFNLKLEAVSRDYNNRGQALARLNKRTTADTAISVKVDAEIRSVLAVIADLNEYSKMRKELLPDDFENPAARQLYQILEDCYQENSLNFHNILSKCNDENLSNLITGTISSGEFKENNDSALQDSILLMKNKNLQKKKEELMVRIRNLKVVTEEDGILMQRLLKEVMNIDELLKHN